MGWSFTADLQGFPAEAEAWLLRDPVRSTVPLTVLNRIRQGDEQNGMLLGWYTGGGAVAGVVVHTPPFPLILGDLPGEAIGALAEALRGREVRGVSGPRETVAAFGAAWPRPVRDRMAMRLYRLGELRPHAVDGEARAAEAGDEELVVAWYRAFFAEAEPANAGVDPTTPVRGRIAEREIVLWEAGGEPVALAALSSPIAGMSRIGPVYTPPRSRRRGYGAAATHAATRSAIDAGAERVLLFTDLANPTSNSIYQALGYRPVDDYASTHFG
ncbi:GNAT family N-acetyltransferase [Microtetraspora sp. NBRC 13810]|uniref:GNAT family N-acetyltransferase n=1 Tax=Microtetraspora sp. NBRC 13810 TaxID=3030990 RepID=UPI0025560C80|nr:GNAT family N-acetyltransferase [Microtetraspora sp. NBRC 13810]